MFQQQEKKVYKYIVEEKTTTYVSIPRIESIFL